MKNVFSVRVLTKNYRKNFIWCLGLLQDFLRFGEVCILCEGKCHKNNLKSFVSHQWHLMQYKFVVKFYKRSCWFATHGFWLISLISDRQRVSPNMSYGDRCVFTDFGRLHKSFVCVFEYSLVRHVGLDWSYVGNCQEIVPVPVLDKFWLVSLRFSRIHTVEGVT